MAFQKKYDLIFGELSYKINGCAYRVHNRIGGFHLESVFEKAIAIEFANSQLPYYE